MSIRTRVLAAAAVLTLTGGLGLSGALTAGAATPSCGPTCLDIFSKNFGTFANPQFTVDVFRQSQKVGQPIILFRDSNSDPALDWDASAQGQVSSFYAVGMVSAALALHYGCNGTIPVAGVQVPCSGNAVNDFAFEDEYAPFGVDSGLCAGVASTAFQGEGVSLQPCGESSRTVWIADTLDSCPGNPLYSAEIPLINGSDTNFSHPFVATYPASKVPTDTPRPQITVTNLTGFTQTGGGAGTCGGSAVNGPDSDQLWSARAGVLP